MDTLDLLDFSRLSNDPIHHDPSWPTIPIRLPSYVPKFHGEPDEDPKNHVMTYHLWCLFDSLMDSYIH